MPKIPKPQKARRLNDIFVPQIPRFRRRGGPEFFVGFSGFAFYVIIYYFTLIYLLLFFSITLIQYFYYKLNLKIHFYLVNIFQ